MTDKLKYADKATQVLAQRAAEGSIELVWDRWEKMQPQCGFGRLGVCCQICTMGPCRIDPFGEGPQIGVCGAEADTIVARNLVRMIAGGSAAHSDHGRDIAHTLIMAAEDSDSDYKIKNEEKLKSVAEVYGIKTAGRELKEIAKELGRCALEEFSRPEGYVQFTTTAPPKRQKLWKDLGILPRAVDREIVETMHRTTMGVDADYKNILKQGMRAALADGWGGSMVATELQDILFGIPNPLRSAANLGVLNRKHVNIVLHGHEPVLSDIIAAVSQNGDLAEKARAKGAEGITVAGICCTANEILMRRGVPIAGSFLQQELAIFTGVVDLMVVDVQCLMPGLKQAAGRYHTKLITTSPKARIP
ncbi:MAG: carbon monoxide dehydrogenase, partial [Spirochaetota bacterium]